MCTHQLLAHSTSGYILQCKECGNFQFAFGTTEIMMDREELHTFQEYLSANSRNLNNAAALHRKTIRITLVNSKVALALTPFEAEELRDLVNEGLATLEVNNLLCEIQ
jgi:hypothetical protein